MTNYFGFAIADSMFPGNCKIERSPIDPQSWKRTIENAVNCCNVTHKATVEAASKRFGLKLSIPEQPPSIALNFGDSLIVMGVRGLPRLTENRHYSDEEIMSADFSFAVYQVVSW